MFDKVIHHIQQWLLNIWYKNSYWYIFFLPLSWLFASLILVRKFVFKRFLQNLYQPPCSVIIVGNITVGGTGKTPFIIWLAKNLKARGLKPAILSRGYGGQISDIPIEVSEYSDPSIVGDEPVMIASKVDCPVIVHSNRVLSCKYISKKNIDLIICDDGLQHYLLKRDYEIVIIDGERVFGNGQLLPAGPLREPISRLNNVDLVLKQINSVSDGVDYDRERAFYLTGGTANNINSGEMRSLSEFIGKKIHAVAGIGNPNRFFNLLADKGIEIERHYYGDHQKYSLDELSFDDDLDILMTEKDAVKCKKFNNDRLWYVPVELEFTNDSQEWLVDIENLVKTRDTND